MRKIRPMRPRPRGVWLKEQKDVAEPELEPGTIAEQLTELPPEAESEHSVEGADAAVDVAEESVEVPLEGESGASID